MSEDVLRQPEEVHALPEAPLEAAEAPSDDLLDMLLGSWAQDPDESFEAVPAAVAEHEVLLADSEHPAPEGEVPVAGAEALAIEHDAEAIHLESANAEEPVALEDAPGSEAVHPQEPAAAILSSEQHVLEPGVEELLALELALVAPRLDLESEPAALETDPAILEAHAEVPPVAEAAREFPEEPVLFEAAAEPTIDEPMQELHESPAVLEAAPEALNIPAIVEAELEQSAELANLEAALEPPTEPVSLEAGVEGPLFEVPQMDPALAALLDMPLAEEEDPELVALAAELAELEAQEALAKAADAERAAAAHRVKESVADPKDEADELAALAAELAELEALEAAAAAAQTSQPELSAEPVEEPSMDLFAALVADSPEAVVEENAPASEDLLAFMAAEEAPVAEDEIEAPVFNLAEEVPAAELFLTEEDIAAPVFELPAESTEFISAVPEDGEWPGQDELAAMLAGFATENPSAEPVEVAEFAEFAADVEQTEEPDLLGGQFFLPEDVDLPVSFVQAQQPIIASSEALLEDLIASVDLEIQAAPLPLTARELAERESSPTTRYVVFTVNGKRFGLPMSEVLETERLPKITAVPNVPEFVHGVANLRGEIVPLLDTRSLLGLGDWDHSTRGSMLVVKPGQDDQLTGLIVDDVNGLADVAPEAIQIPVTPVVPQLASVLTGVCEHREHELNLINLQAFFASPELQQLTAQ